MTLKENCIITVRGTMEQGNDTDSVELMTRGSFAHKTGSFFVTYKETEATGYEGCTTTLKISEDSRQAAILRFGRVPSQLFLEKGVRHLCHYETGYGAMSLGVEADEIVCGFTERGGNARFSYTLDSGNESFISRNLVDITVKEIPNPISNPISNEIPN